MDGLEVRRDGNQPKVKDIELTRVLSPASLMSPRQTRR